jgi:polysaccharide deacetylase 2 family uncharacterized protein YibQ
MSDLGTPLRRRRLRQTAASIERPPRHIPVARIAAGLTGLILAVFVGRILLVDDPMGGRPTASAEIAPAGSTNTLASEVTPAQGGTATITALGDAQHVGDVGHGDSAAAGTPAAPDELAFIDPELEEQTEFGAIPRMAGTGRKPFDAYRRSDAAAADAASGPRIAIIVSGLGLNFSGTQEAIEKLPDTVTLAFAPYGKSLKQNVTTARQQGHEIFLEVPLEPFDYPDNDPGPDTLLTGQAPRDNLNRLYSVMSKFPGYAGVINNMGAKFTASGADFGPMMEELAARGLGYVDDGSSNRSLAPQLAAANRLPFARVTNTLDADPTRNAILDALDQLVAKARQDGSAVGLISALPVSIETLSDWARQLGDTGVEIVPMSALMKG